MLDLRIDNAEIYDGTGAKPFNGSLGIKNGKIVSIGESKKNAKELFNADGLALMPGIIDNHTHYDAQITWDPFVNPSTSLGVTTIVMGNCGFTIAPCRPADRDLTIRNLTHVEGMPLKSLQEGINWGFESFTEYMDMLVSRGVGPNVAVFCGHSSIRTYVLGNDAHKRTATPKEVRQMKVILREALQAGACGFSTTRSGQHNGEAGIPMPSRLADFDELQELSKVLKDVGYGTLMMTKGGDTSIQEIEHLASISGRPYLIAALLHSPMAPEKTFNDLEEIAGANERGSNLYGAVSPCPLTMEFTMHEPYVFEGLKVWKPLMKMNDSEFKKTLRDKKFREKMRSELSIRAYRIFNGEWNKVKVTQVSNKENVKLEGRDLASIAKKEGCDPLDYMFDLALDENLDTMFTATVMNSDEKAVGRMINDENALISLSDAGAHLTFFCDAGYGLHLLGHWSRDLGVLSLSHAIKKLTSDPSKVFGIQKRGQLKLEYWADLLLFDPETVGRGELSRVHDLPADGSRLTTPARGVHGVWINGTMIADHQGMLPHAPMAGSVLRSFDP